MTSFFQAQRAVNLTKIPDQSGKTFIVTGGNTGLGYEVVKALAAKNAHVFMTSRNVERQQGCVAMFRDLTLFRGCLRNHVGHTHWPEAHTGPSRGSNTITLEHGLKDCLQTT